MLERRNLTLASAVLTCCVYAVSGAADDTTASFQRVLIDADPPARPYYKMAGDLTGDGRPEIVIGGAAGPLVMYVAPDWQRSAIATAGYEGGVNGELADLNTDGRLDVVMGGVVWFENPATRGGKWTVHRIDRQQIHDIEVADLDADGLPDLVCRDQSAFGDRGDKIFVYRQRSSEEWNKQILDCPHGEGLKLADLDADGDADIVIGGLWFENNSNTWTEHAYAPDWEELDTKVDVGDLNGDGRPDIVVTPSELKGERYRLSWFEAPVTATAQPWTEHVLVPDIECVIHALALADFNRDGRLDIAAAEMHQGADPDEVFVLFNFDNGSDWKKVVIDTAGSHDIVAADFDVDGDFDLLGANHAGTHPVVIWVNQQVP